MTQAIHKTHCEKCGAKTLQVSPINNDKTMPLSQLVGIMPARVVHCVGCGALLYGGA